jgi:hypothetical protein
MRKEYQDKFQMFSERVNKKILVRDLEDHCQRGSKITGSTRGDVTNNCFNRNKNSTISIEDTTELLKLP